MHTTELLEQIYNTYGLVIVLKDALWSLEGVSQNNQRKFTGILALIDSIEQGMNEIKLEFENVITIQGKWPYLLYGFMQWKGLSFID